MNYRIEDINRQAREDPKGFIERSEERYQEQIDKTAALVAERMRQRPVVLLNGPSSSGKTTSASLLVQALGRHGVLAEMISMDDYYRTRHEYVVPKDEFGLDDYESPECMDLPMLHDHLQRLVRGEEIAVPRFDFTLQSRVEETYPVRLTKDKVVVIEGIHALNEVITGGLEENATGIYLSVASQVELEEGVTLPPELLRFMRRAIRDRNFRGASVESTMVQWRSVRRGERLYIAPFVHHAALSIDTYLPYEGCILMNRLQGRLIGRESQMMAEGLGRLCQAMGRFDPIEFSPFMPKNSLLHEFIG